MEHAIAWICATCGVQYSPSMEPPGRCPICEDPRQYVGWQGQQWLSPEELRTGHHSEIVEEEPDLWSIRTEPHFAIGQRCFLVRTREGNLLWDCVSLLDQPALEAIGRMGGVQAIAISHPHYYSAMAEWSAAFDDAPIYVHEADRPWATRPDAPVRYWRGEAHRLWGGLELKLCGGHFDGFQVAIWSEGAGGKGVLLAGDQPQVAMDRRWVSFLYSYPNMVPLGPGAVRRIARVLDACRFDRQYGAFAGRTIPEGARAVIRRSAERYLAAVGHPGLME